MPSDLELLGRLLLAAVLGGAVGAERELHDQPAGLRTHMLLTIGACLFTLVSAYGFGGPTDPSRLAAQIVTGIGFLGGGAIVRPRLDPAGAAGQHATAAHPTWPAVLTPSARRPQIGRPAWGDRLGCASRPSQVWSAGVPRLRPLPQRELVQLWLVLLERFAYQRLSTDD
jgi:MgtC family